MLETGSSFLLLDIINIMKIKLESISVSDLDRALAFYTDVLGFVKKQDLPASETGAGARFVTVVSPEEPDGTELLLEPSGEHAATKAYKKALFEEGIPFTAFLVDDIDSEYALLKSRGVSFRGEPKIVGKVRLAIFDDTFGNLILIYQEHDN